MAEALGRAVGEARQDRGQLFADGKAKSAATLHDGEDRRDLGTCVFVADMHPVLAAMAIPQTFCPCRAGIGDSL